MSSSENESDNQVDCDEDTLCKYGTQLPQFEAGEKIAKFLSMFMKIISPF